MVLGGYRMTAAQTIGELIQQYARYRRRWISWFHTANGFHDWFTEEVLR